MCSKWNVHFELQPNNSLCALYLLMMNSVFGMVLLLSTNESELIFTQSSSECLIMFYLTSLVLKKIKTHINLLKKHNSALLLTCGLVYCGLILANDIKSKVVLLFCNVEGSARGL